MFSSTPVERLSRQIIVELNPTRVSQIQLPKNPDPPDTRTLFPSINPGRVNVEVPVYNLLDAVGELELASEPSLRRLQCLEYYRVEHVDGHDRQFRSRLGWFLDETFHLHEPIGHSLTFHDPKS